MRSASSSERSTEWHGPPAAPRIPTFSASRRSRPSRRAWPTVAEPAREAPGRDARGGRLYAGTSGFAYPDWSPRFYPSGAKGNALLPFYATRFAACELNNTFYQQPKPEKVAAWLAATPATFRFAVKAQRGGSMRALLADPTESVPWLTGPLRAFGARLGTVLYRVPANVKADVPRLQALLEVWPSDLPLTVELQDASWALDEVDEALSAAGAVRCATDMPDEPAPTIRATGPFLYLRLRRHDYADAEVAAWADRLAPFLESGRDAFVFFRHDEVGRATELAAGLNRAVAARLGEAALAEGAATAARGLQG
jgi:uncharacterized protein YecE (DUF72 family)